MVKDFTLFKDEAALIVTLLMLSDERQAYDLADQIRENFGIPSQDDELQARGITLSQFRQTWGKKLIGDNNDQ